MDETRRRRVCSTDSNVVVASSPPVVERSATSTSFKRRTADRPTPPARLVLATDWRLHRPSVLPSVMDSDTMAMAGNLTVNLAVQRRAAMPDNALWTCPTDDVISHVPRTREPHPTWGCHIYHQLRAGLRCLLLKNLRLYLNIENTTCEESLSFGDWETQISPPDESSLQIASTKSFCFIKINTQFFKQRNKLLEYLLKYGKWIKK